VRFPQTGPQPLLLDDDEDDDELLLEDEDELLLDEDAALLLDDALELVAMPPLLLDDVTPLPPLPVDAWPLLFVPVEFVWAPPAPPAPPALCSSGPPVMSLMTPVQAPRARASAENAKSVRWCMILRLYGR
jgi:hypothetical protein